MKKNSTRQANRKVWETKEVERVCVAIYLPGFLMATRKGGYLARLVLTPLLFGRKFPGS